MRWIEILEIRSFGNKQTQAYQDLPALFADFAKEKNLEHIEIYCHGELGSDWSIHIHYHAETATAGRSIFGIRLVSMLKDYGFVHHTIWNEVQRYEKKMGNQK